MNRQKAEEKDMGRSHRQKAKKWAGQVNRQARQGKRSQPARQGNKAVREKDRLIILLLCIKFAARNKYINK